MASRNVMSASSKVYRRLRKLGVEASVLKNAGEMGTPSEVLTTGFMAIKRLTAASSTITQHGQGYQSITYTRFRQKVQRELMGQLEGKHMELTVHAVYADTESPPDCGGGVTLEKASNAQRS